MSQYTLRLAASTETLLNEIQSGATQKSVAMTYALAMRDAMNETDWPKVNAAIMQRWSLAGLERIKKLAWSGKAFS